MQLPTKDPILGMPVEYNFQVSIPDRKELCNDPFVQINKVWYTYIWLQNRTRPRDGFLCRGTKTSINLGTHTKP